METIGSRLLLLWVADWPCRTSIKSHAPLQPRGSVSGLGPINPAMNLNRGYLFKG